MLWAGRWGVMAVTITGAEVDRLIAGLGLSVEALWLAYLHDGGTVSCGQIERFLDGDLELDADQRDVLAKVVVRRVVAPHPSPSARRRRRRRVDLDLTLAESTVEPSRETTLVGSIGPPAGQLH